MTPWIYRECAGPDWYLLGDAALLDGPGFWKWCFPSTDVWDLWGSLPKHHASGFRIVSVSRRCILLVDKRFFGKVASQAPIHLAPPEDNIIFREHNYSP